MSSKAQFVDDLRFAINKNSMEAGSDTPDFILAEYLADCLDQFNKVMKTRTNYYKPPAPVFCTVCGGSGWVMAGHNSSDSVECYQCASPGL